MSDHSETWEDHETSLAAAETMSILNEAAEERRGTLTVEEATAACLARAEVLRRNRETIDGVWAERSAEQAKQESEMQQKNMDHRRQNFMVEVSPNRHPAEEGEIRVSITYNQVMWHTFTLTRGERCVLVDALKNYQP